MRFTLLRFRDGTTCKMHKRARLFQSHRSARAGYDSGAAAIERRGRYCRRAAPTEDTDRATTNVHPRRGVPGRIIVPELVRLQSLMIRRTFRIATLLFSPLAFACGDAGRDAGASRVATFDEAFATTGRIRLHESDSVLNVVSCVYPDSDDGYLVADGREHRVRKYWPDGTLAWQFGREGDGPGEVRSPRVVLRMPDRSLLVGETAQRFTVFDSLGTAPLAVHHTPFTRVEDAVVVGPDAVYRPLTAPPRVGWYGCPRSCERASLADCGVVRLDISCLAAASYSRRAGGAWFFGGRAGLEIEVLKTAATPVRHADPTTATSGRVRCVVASSSRPQSPLPPRERSVAPAVPRGPRRRYGTGVPSRYASCSWGAPVSSGPTWFATPWTVAIG
jgi:hypothetical protein